MPVNESVDLAELFESAPGYIAVVRGPEHVFVVANAAYRQLIGNRELIGKPVREVLPELEAQGLLDLLDQVLQTGKPFVANSVPVQLQRPPPNEPETRFVSFIYQPMTDADGRVTGIFAEGVDVTPAAEADLARRKAERGLQAVLNNASVAIFLMDDKQQCSYMNAAAERLTGYTLAETRGRPLHDVIHHTRPDGSHFPLEDCPIDRAFPEDHNMQGEEIFVHKDGHFYPVAFTASPIRDDESSTVGTIIEVRDISAEKAAQERQHLLINELNHRVKNTLAIVQSLAQQSLREEGSPAEVKQAFESRLAALSRAHDVLTRQSWEAASIHQLIEVTVAPYAGQPSRFEIEGPDLLLAAETAVTLALALHELATNAAKHGALSAPEGHVDVRWTAEDGSLKFVWAESGGPEVTPPKRRGFGSRMIERALAAELDGTASLHFRREGLVCAVDAPWPQRRITPQGTSAAPV